MLRICTRPGLPHQVSSTTRNGRSPDHHMCPDAGREHGNVCPLGLSIGGLIDSANGYPGHAWVAANKLRVRERTLSPSQREIADKERTSPRSQQVLPREGSKHDGRVK